MYCNNCGNQITSEDKFCKNCGTEVQNNSATEMQVPNQQVNQLDNEVNQINPVYQDVSAVDPKVQTTSYQKQANNNFKNRGVQSSPNRKRTNPFIVVGIFLGFFVIMFAISFLILIIGDTNNIDRDINSSNSNNSNNNNNNNNNSNNSGNINSNSTSKIKGTFSREIFSNRSFNYKTSSSDAVFKFNSDSTFECAYVGGNTYKGTYEVYNGLFITVKAGEIEIDSSINGAKALASDINKVANAMMSDGESMLNVYLLYLRVDKLTKNGTTSEVDLLQPFAVKYDPDTNTGSAVNVMGAVQGSLKLR